MNARMAGRRTQPDARGRTMVLPEGVSFGLCARAQKRLLPAPTRRPQPRWPQALRSCCGHRRDCRPAEGCLRGRDPGWAWWQCPEPATPQGPACHRLRQQPRPLNKPFGEDGRSPHVVADEADAFCFALALRPYFCNLLRSRLRSNASSCLAPQALPRRVDGRGRGRIREPEAVPGGGDYEDDGGDYYYEGEEAASCRPRAELVSTRGSRAAEAARAPGRSDFDVRG